MARDLLASTADDSLAVRILDILRRRRLLALAAFSAVLAAAVSFAIYLPDIYQGRALVLVERPVDENIVRSAESAPGELESRLHIIKQEILSRDRALALINRFHLYPKLLTHGAIDDALNQMRSDVEVNPSGPEQVSGKVKTVSFTLKYTGDSAKTAADVTNAIASFYVQQNDSMRSQSALGTLKFLREQLAEAKGQLDRQDSMITQYTTKYTGQLPQQVGMNLATLERMNTQLRLNGEQQIRLIEQREKLMDGLQDPTNVARAENPDGAPEREQEYALITRDRQVAKDLYDSMLKRYDEAQLSASVETDRQGEQFRVLEQALPPEGPTGPNRIRLILMGILLAIAAAVAMVLTAEQFDASFHGIDELREFTSVPILVSIPPIGPMPLKRRLFTGLATVSVIAMIALIATASAYLAHGNDQLARLIGRAG